MRGAQVGERDAAGDLDGMVARRAHPPDDRLPAGQLVHEAGGAEPAIRHGLAEGLLQPATILCALPLALAGALFALWLTSQSFSMPAVIGVLMLMGIVTKNSILLVEYAIMARREKVMNRLEAIMDACHKRARPIVMTTIAMGAGMLPNALGMGAEPSFRQPMAIVVIGGLITSTVLSLLVIPVVFTYVDDALEWFRRVVRNRQHQQNIVTP